jgi:pectinesterase
MTILHLSPSDDLQYILDNVTTPATIYLAAGVYQQKVVVKKNNIAIIGKNREKTVISWSDYAKKTNLDGREFNTFRTFTVCVIGENVTFNNFTIENSNTEPEKVGQCVALSVNAKNFYAKDMTLRSTQDTLFTAPFPDDLVIRYSGLTDDPTYYDGFIPKDQLYMEGNAVQIYEDCDIYGTVDYVFGCAEAYFKGCRFISTYEKRHFGYVAAPAHSLKQSEGYTFLDCDFVCGGAEKSTVYLARPWRDFGKCNFINCKLGEHINGELFDKWNDTYRDKTARFGYFNLTSENKLAPVTWGKQLTEKQYEEIHSRFLTAYTAITPNK